MDDLNYKLEGTVTTVKHYLHLELEKDTDFYCVDHKNSVTLSPNEDVVEVFMDDLQELFKKEFKPSEEFLDCIILIEYAYDRKSFRKGDHPETIKDRKYTKLLNLELVDRIRLKSFKKDTESLPTIEDYNFTPDVG